MGVLKHIYKNKLIYIIVLVFFVLKLFTLSMYKTIWWDSAVYIGMGKYIYSLGNSGVWEASRPLVWPLILGSLWKLNLDVVLFGKIVEIIFGGLCIFVTFLIGRELFGYGAALLSSLLLAISPTFFLFNGVMLTEIVSTFFSLLGIYFIIKRRHLASGLLFGISFMARFLQFFVFVSVILAYLFYFDRRHFKDLIKILGGFSLVVFLYLILNQILYNDALYPFLQQVYLTKNSGWFNYHSLNFYFLGLFAENFLYFLSFIGLIFILKNKSRDKMMIGIIFLFLFVFFNYIKQKEMRFLIILMPYMYLLVAYAMSRLHEKIKFPNFKILFPVMILILLVVSIRAINASYSEESVKPNAYDGLQQFFLENDIKGDVWVSNPIIPLYANDKSANLMYYPVPNETKKEMLILEESDFVFLDTCDLECAPSDADCKTGWSKVINSLKNRMKTEFSIKNNGCEQYVFKR